MANKERIQYDADAEAWTISQGCQTYPLHCGECFDLAIGAIWLPCRLEMDANWYVLLKGTKLILHPRTIYAVRM